MPIIFSDQVVVVKEEEIDFSYGTLGLSDSELIDLGGSEYVKFGPGILGAFQELRNVAFVDSPSVEDTTSELPPSADPPFPPVWPYPFVGGLIYGREHLGMNLRMIREDDFVFSAIVIDENGDPEDLTDCVLTLRAKWNVRDADASSVFVCTSDPANGIVINPPATDGNFTVTIASSKTTALPLYRVFLTYQIRLVRADASIKTILKGTLIVAPNVVDP